LSSNGTTFDETNNFRIEDKMHHREDTDLSVTNGLITWVAGNVFVTAPGTHSPGSTDTDSSIQRGVDAASAGNTVNVEAGTFTENVTISKAITVLGSVDGLGTATTNIHGSSGSTIFQISGSGFGADQTVNIDNVNLDGLTGTADWGIHALGSASFQKLT